MTIFITPPFAEAQARKMPAKKKHSRPVQLHPQPTASDYDTDTAYYTENQQPQLPLAAPPQRSAAELNMLVLQRWYPDIDSIIAIAPFAVLYSFSPDAQQWDKCDTQGSLFVCRLSPLPESDSPRYRVIILNRRNPKNFELDLVTTEDIEVTEEFVIIPLIDAETGSPQIYGIWVFKDADSEINMREHIATVILECAGLAEQASVDGGRVEPYTEQESEQNGHSVDFYGNDGASTLLQPENTPLSMTGQSIDLTTLFAKPSRQSEPAASISYLEAGNQNQRQPQRFAPTAENEFFRAPNNLAGAPSTGLQPPRPGSQQNALLDLFKNAKKG